MINMVRCDTCSFLPSFLAGFYTSIRPNHAGHNNDNNNNNQQRHQQTTMNNDNNINNDGGTVDNGWRLTDATADRFEEGATQFRKDVWVTKIVWKYVLYLIVHMSTTCVFSQHAVECKVPGPQVLLCVFFTLKSFLHFKIAPFYRIYPSTSSRAAEHTSSSSVMVSGELTN